MKTHGSFILGQHTPVFLIISGLWTGQLLDESLSLLQVAPGAQPLPRHTASPQGPSLSPGAQPLPRHPAAPWAPRLSLGALSLEPSLSLSSPWMPMWKHRSQLSGPALIFSQVLLRYSPFPYCSHSLRVLTLTTSWGSSPHETPSCFYVLVQ